MTLQLDAVSESQPRALVLAVLAVDEAGNRAELSNLVTVGLGVAPDVNTQEFLAEMQKRPAEKGPRVSNLALVIAVGFCGSLLLITFFVTVIIHLLIEAGCIKRRMPWEVKSSIV